MRLKIKFYENNEDFMPVQAHKGDAGFDLKARKIVVYDNGVKTFELDLKEREYCLPPCGRCLVLTGIFIEFSPKYELQIRPRSGLALKYGITIVNSPGTVDSGYRNEIGVILLNTGKRSFPIRYCDRIAQAVVQEIPQVALLKTKKLFDSERGQDGFGSTGK